MARAVRAWRPDVVHVFKPKGPSGLCAALLWGARRAGGPPLVIDADDWEGPGGWNDDQRLRYSAAERLVFAWQERFGLTHADAWTATTRCLAERAAQFGADPARVVVMPNGVPDPSVWERTPPSVPGDHPGRVLLYTRFAGVRPEAVGEVWGRVLAATAESAKPPSLVVAGAPAGADVQGVLRGMPGVAWMGPVAEPDLPGLLTAVAAALVPWEDTNRNRARSSVKVRELMAAGTPVAAYRVGELEGTLGAAGRGRLAAPEDAAALAAIVLGLLRDPAAAGAMGAALRERALSIYRWDRLAGAALEAYGIAGAGR
jgi:glycosyltransferase involved in cell wall biosynthesis